MTTLIKEVRFRLTDESTLWYDEVRQADGGVPCATSDFYGGWLFMTNAQRHHWSWLRYLGIAFLILVIAAVAVGGWLLLHAVRVACQSEDNFDATLFTVRLVEEFVYENGRWPVSWDELEHFRFSGNAPLPRSGRGLAMQGHKWPGEAKWIKQHVAIDFQIDPNVVATQDLKNFEAIRPIGPYYEYRGEGYVKSLQETLGQAIETKGQKKTPTKDGRQ